MPAISASAPAKSILFGEHAVVYGRPAIAIPIRELRSHVYISANPRGKTGIQWLDAPDIQEKCFSNELAPEHPIRFAIQSVADFFHIDHYPSCEIRITSEIPIASGLGSSASTAVALVRALTMFLGKTLDQASMNKISFEIEKITHGTPSGIDNSVITYEKPVYYIKDFPIEFLKIRRPFEFVIANSGIASLTRTVVAQIREKWINEKTKFEGLFDKIGKISLEAKQTLLNGDLQKCGNLMSANHDLLGILGVSCEALDHLVEAAVKAGALGAKLCGSGQGGNMIALVDGSVDKERIQTALLTAGAVATCVTHLIPEG